MSEVLNPDIEANSADSLPGESRQALAPRLLNPSDPSYKSVEELRIAMSMQECRNIAITGVYGSGKSSVINTYLSTNNVPTKALRISLSNLIPTDADLSKPEEKIKYENEIEYKIFQQIIHKADYRSTAQSRFRRINILTPETVQKLACNCILFFICFVILFEPKTLQIASFYYAYNRIFGSWSVNINIIADCVCAIIMLTQFYFVFKIAIPKLYSFRISSLKADKFKVNFEDKQMIFSKKLAEILYYLKAGKYEAVIFEDLDRITHSQDLFLKLREINILLNESEYYQKKNRIIRFVYAVRDDLFNQEARTKFFDYIIPVVPTVDYSNSGEYMISHCKDVLSDIRDIDIKTLGLFVPRMRDLVNIINEYRLYKATINNAQQLEPRKLLAIIIYKNLYPGDYSLLHAKKGYLYSVLANKHLFYEGLIKDDRDELHNVAEKIKTLDESIVKRRNVVLNELAKEHHITKLSISGKPYSLEEVANDSELYEAFENNNIDLCLVDMPDDDDSGYRNYTFDFDSLREGIDTDNMYYEQMGEDYKALSALERRKQELEVKINSVRNMSSTKLMRLIGNGNTSLGIVKNICNEVQSNIDENNNEESTDVTAISTLIHGLIRNGYIKEDYSKYITFTYYGTYGEKEFKFLQSVIQGITLEYEYPLKNIGAFINDISSENYDTQSILNYSLANYVFGKDGTEAQKNSFIRTARKHHDFVIGYDKVMGNKADFFERLFVDWNGCVSFIHSLKEQETRNTYLRLYFRTCPQTVPLILTEREYINTLYGFICENIKLFDVNKLKGYITTSNIYFSELTSPLQESQEFYDFVIRFQNFAINTHNMLIIYGDNFKTEAITCILEGNDSVKSYILEDMDLLLSQIPATSKKESETALVFLANNKDITDEQFSSYLNNQSIKITNLKDIRAERYELLVSGDYIVPSWDNVRQFYASGNESSIIISFINLHAKELADTRLADGDEKLQVDLFGNNITLGIDAYRMLVNSCELIFAPEEIEGINTERLEILLDNGLLEYSSAYNSFMSNYPPYLLAQYIIRYFDDMVSDTNDVNFENSNILGIEILESSLPVEKKALFLKKFAWIETEENKDEGCDTFARMICEFYLQNDCTNADFDLIVNALDIYNGEGTWLPKIELINKIHRSTEYSEERSTRLVNTLGTPYTELNTSGGERTELDNNPQNNELVDYLRDKGRFIHQKRQKGDKIRVFYR